MLDSIAKRILLHSPRIKHDLHRANLKIKPEDFIKTSLKTAVIYASFFAVIFFFVFSQMKVSIAWILALYPVLLIVFYNYSFLGLKSKISKRRRQMDAEVLFVGRYLLVKLHAGQPLTNAIEDISHSYGFGALYFREIMEEISTGTPVERALENAVEYTPSDNFRKILFQMNNALKLGIDVSRPLESVIEEIESKQIVGIKAYGKKLNSLVIFYMLLGIVIPSLGMTMFIIIASFVGMKLDLGSFTVILFFVAIIQFIFVSIFKAARPSTIV